MTKTVLVVDDEESIRRLCARILARLGHRVLLADGLNSAVRLMGEAPDMLLTDLKIEDGDGRTVARRFLELHPHAPVIMMTGTSEPVDDAQVKAELGVRVLLQKPFRVQELEDAVLESALENRCEFP